MHSSIIYPAKEGGMKKSFVFVIPFLLFIFACRYLPFDKNLELAAGTISKLNLESTIGPVQIADFCYDPNSKKVLFMPDKQNYVTGYVILTSADGSAIAEYLYRDAFNNVRLSAQHSFYVRNSSPYKPNAFVETLPGAGNESYLFYVLFDWDTTVVPAVPHPAYNILFLNGSSLGSVYATDMNLISDYLGAQAVVVNGAFIHPSNNQLYLLFTNTTGNFAEVNASVNTGGPGTSSITRSVSPPNFDPVLAKPYALDLFYSYDPATSKSFISYARTDGIQNYWWNSAAANKYSDAYPRVRILSNGNLLSIDNGMMYGFDQAGRQLYKFPLGDLRYIYEKLDSVSGEYKMVFELTTVAYSNHDSCNASYTFQVYSYPTQKVASLNF
jgi:hypothetical protein